MELPADVQAALDRAAMVDGSRQGTVVQPGTNGGRPAPQPEPTPEVPDDARELVGPNICIVCGEPQLGVHYHESDVDDEDDDSPIYDYFQVLIEDPTHFLKVAIEAAKAIGRRSPLPVLQCLWMDASEDGFRMRSTDLEVTVDIGYDLTIHGHGTVLVTFKDLRTALEMADKETLAMVEDDGELVITGGGGLNTRLQTTDLGEWPKFNPDFGAPVGWPVDEFVGGLRVLEAVSTDDARPILTGVSFDSNDDGYVTMVATDSYRLATYQTEFPKAWAKGEPLVPAVGLNLIKRWLTTKTVARVLDLGDEPTINFRCNDREALFEIGNVALTTRLIEGSFPNWRQLIPEKVETITTFNKAEMTKRVKGLKKAGDKMPVVIDLEAFEVYLKREGNTFGGFVEMEVDGDDMVVAFNAHYLLRGLMALNEDSATLELQDPLKPGLLQEGDFTYLLMPVRL